MDDVKILDIFYTKIVPEARSGKIDCFFAVNMVFNLNIDNRDVSRCDALPYDDILIPTLKITNRHLFDNLLIEYVNRARNFYDHSNFKFLDDLDMMNIPKVEDLKDEYLIAYIICMLFANATFDDFADPVTFLESRIAMFDQRILPSNGIVDFGYLDTIGANLYLEEEVSPIKAESPYRIVGYLEFDNGYRLVLPEIYAGKTQDKYQIYGIQKTTPSDALEERHYLKSIRKGMIAKINGAPEHYFLSVMAFLSLCSDKPIEVVPFLVERWNAKRIALINKAGRNPDITQEDIEREQIKIQSNLTDILIRYFTKLEDVTEGMDLSLTPLEMDSNLHIQMSDSINSRSILFNELFTKAKDYQKHNKSNLGR